MFYEFSKTVSASICRTPGPSKKNRATEVKMLQSRVRSHILRKKSPRIFIASNLPRWLTPGKKRWLGFSPLQTGPTKSTPKTDRGDKNGPAMVGSSSRVTFDDTPNSESMAEERFNVWSQPQSQRFFLEIPNGCPVIRTSNKLRRGVKMEDGISFGMMDSWF